MNIVILAGGAGTRLWPLGRKYTPKQFSPVLGKKALVEQTYDRFKKKYGVDKIYFSTTKQLLPQLRKMFPKTPRSKFIVEPSRRDTAGAMGFVALHLSLSQPNEPMAFIPSDHFIVDPKKYLACFTVAEKMIKKTGKLLDIGIAATFPSTVLGYTKIGKRYLEDHGVEVFNFAGHTEKPNLTKATKYLLSGEYLWHGNYYMWTPVKFLGAVQKHSPGIYSTLMQMKKFLGKDESKVDEIYNKIEKDSFDYAVTEKINKKEVLIIKGEFGWSDIGAWDVLHNQLRDGGDEAGNVVKGKVVHLDTEDSLLYGHGKKVLGVIGLKNVVVVDTADALLVCPKDRAQDVKKLLEVIESRGGKKYL